jgi:zinc transport system substrate-binding protein
MGCAKKTVSPGALVVPIAPYKTILQGIVGDTHPITVLIPPGREPHDFEPTPGQLTRLAGAAIYFQLGMPFEDTMLEKLRQINPKLKVVDLRQGIVLRPNDEPLLEFGEGESEEDSPKDPHIWLSPALLATQAATMADAVKALDPDREAAFDSGFLSVTTRLTEVSESIKAQLAALPSRNIMVFHPAFGYFCDEFDLKQIPIEIHGKSPAAKDLGLLIKLARDKHISVIFAEEQFSTKEAETVSKALGGRVVMLDPMVEDVYTNIANIATIIRESVLQ